MELPIDSPKPRLCHIIKWPDFDGYGFNLHAEKSKIGQYIGKVDSESPALYAGLIEGDKIVEVNGVNISNENHRQVVERIKSIPNETKLLVIDEFGDKWYKERKITIKSTQTNVIYMKTPVPRPVKLIAVSNDEQHVNGIVSEESVNKDEETKENEKIVDSGIEGEKLTETTIITTTTNESSEEHEIEITDKEENVITNADENHNVSNDDNNNDDNNNENKELVTVKSNESDDSLEDKEIEVNINNNNNSNKNNNHIDDNKVIEKAKNMEAKHNDDDGSIASSSPHSIKKMSSNGLITENSSNNKRPSSIASEESNSKTNSIPGSPVSTKSGSIISKDGMSNSGDLLNLNMSASEMRKLLAQRKKVDPKKAQMDLKQKYEIIQQM